jgi:hypothetical protein
MADVLGDLIDIRRAGDAHLDDALLVVEFEELVVPAQIIQGGGNLTFVVHIGHESSDVIVGAFARL